MRVRFKKFTLFRKISYVDLKIYVEVRDGEVLTVGRNWAYADDWAQHIQRGSIMRALAGMLSILSFLAGAGYIATAILLPSSFYTSSAIQQSAVYAMGTHYSAIGIGLFAAAAVLGMMYYGGEILDRLTANAVASTAIAFQGDLGSAPMSDEQRRLMERAKQLINEGKRTEAAKLLERVNHPKAIEWIGKLQ